MAAANTSDILEREREILDLFKSQDITLSANRLCDFVTDFCTNSDWRKECIVYCNRAATIKEAEKRRKLSFKEFMDEVTSLLYDMMDLLESIKNELLNLCQAA